MDYNIWDQTHYPWGYQIRVDFILDDGSISNQVLVFREKPLKIDEKSGDVLEWEIPEDATIDAAVSNLWDRISAASVTGDEAALNSKINDLTRQIVAAQSELSETIMTRDVAKAVRLALPNPIGKLATDGGVK